MRLLITLLLALLLVACGKPEPDKPAVNQSTAVAVAPVLPAAAKAQLTALQQQLQTLEDAAKSLSSTPDAAHLSAAQSAWKNAYTSFNQSLDWLLGDARNQQRIAKRIDALPIQPGYVDALKLWPDSGLVNDPTVTLDAASLLQQNQPTDDTEVSLGFQVVQFLLWGSDELPRKADDFKLERRSLYLALVTQQLTQDIAAVVASCESQGCDAKLGKQAHQQRLDVIKAAAASSDAYLSPLSASIASAAH